MLTLLGFLPGGVKESILRKMWWGNAFETSLERLHGLAVFEVGVPKLVLIPTMIEHVETHTDELEKRKIVTHICGYFKSLLSEYFL